jgi:lipid-A-disaccharide synthase
MNPTQILLVAGDPSGDRHAAALLARLNRTGRTFRFFGIGGPAMQAQGLEPLLPFGPFNKMGFKEVLLHIPFFLEARRRIKREMKKRRPAALVCVDYPGLNIRLMADAHRLGIPVVWYIVPQVWAWKRRRARILGEQASHIAVVFPFETALFTPFRAPVSYVGHPLVEAMKEHGPAEAQTNAAPSPPSSIALVPGSRPQEVAMMLPVMVGAFRILRGIYPRLQGTISRCDGLPGRFFDRYVNESGMKIDPSPLPVLLEKADLAAVTSGTATLETALMGVPMVIVYKTSAINYAILKHFVSMPYIGLPNIVAGEKIVPELIQNDFTAQKLSEALKVFIEDRNSYAVASSRLSALKQLLGEKSASRETARIVVSCLK